MSLLISQNIYIVDKRKILISDFDTKQNKCKNDDDNYTTHMRITRKTIYKFKEGEAGLTKKM